MSSGRPPPLAFSPPSASASDFASTSVTFFFLPRVARGFGAGSSALSVAVSVALSFLRFFAAAGSSVFSVFPASSFAAAAVSGDCTSKANGADACGGASSFTMRAEMANASLAPSSCWHSDAICALRRCRSSRSFSSILSFASICITCCSIVFEAAMAVACALYSAGAKFGDRFERSPLFLRA